MGIEIHLNFVKRVVSQIKTDDRFTGMALGGSWLDKRLDEFSDLDIYLIMADHRTLSFIEKKKILGQWGKILCFYPDSNDKNVSVCLYNFKQQLLHVDCKWIDLIGFRKRVENQEIVIDKDGMLSKCLIDFPSEGYEIPDLELNEMRFWTWMHYVLAKIGRGEIFEACSYLCEVRSYCL